MSNGTVYRRETPSGASSWVAHVAWYEAGKRRQMKRTFRTKKDAQKAPPPSGKPTSGTVHRPATV